MVQLTKSQLDAVTILKSSNLSLLTGGGGTGKTTTLAEWVKQTPKRLTFCYAPTGKAAQRMQEAFSEAGVNLDSRTIHSGLIPDRCGYDGRGWTFRYNAENQLLCDRVIIDESSMIDISAMSWLLAAIRPGTQVVLVGDDFQLPPVGKGCPFKDMIESGKFPHANLTEVHRFAGRIAHVCGAIRKGKTFEAAKRLNLDRDAGEYGPDNYIHLERRSSSDILYVMDALMDKVRGYGFDPVEDVQVIVTRNDAGGLSRKVVNPRLQHLLNPKGESYSKCPFKVGDKVVCKRNATRDTFALYGSRQEKDGSVCYVANGEDGIVRAINDRAIFVQFRDGIVSFSRGGWGNEVVLGYALTCHSSQGSGWPVVVYLIDDCRLNDRNLVYTGLSRPKKLLFTVGQMNALRGQLRRSQLKQRKTFLKEMLCGTV